MCEVNASGTFLRRRTEKSDLARPHSVHPDIWNNFTRSEKLKLIKELKAETETKGAAAVGGFRVFNTTLQKRATSVFPPAAAPSPDAVVRRLVIDMDDDMVVYDEDVRGWKYDDCIVNQR